jgi:uncharacterized protein (TIGR01777 family)
MRVIITGGTGLIGTALSQQLAAAGYDVVVLSRRAPGTVALPAGIAAAQWDSRTASGWGHLAEGAKAIVNLAGSSIGGTGFLPSRWNPERKRRILQSRLDAANAVLDAVEQAESKPEVIIQASGIDYYASVPKSQSVTEETPAGDGFLADVCLQWEAAMKPVEKHGVRLATIRTGLVLDDEGGSLPWILLPHRLFVGGWFGSGKQWFSWIHRDDEARAIQYLIESPESAGSYNLTAPDPATSRTFAHAVGRVLRRPTFMPVPAFAIKLMFGEVGQLVLEGQRVLPARLQAEGFHFEHPELEAALHDLLR